MAINGTTKSVSAQCQIVWFKWKSDLVPVTRPIDDCEDALAYDISNHLIESCSFSKNIGEPAGAFSFRLDSSRDWKDLIKPGQWCLIYMSNGGNLELPSETADILPTYSSNTRNHRANLRGICFIERVSALGSTNANGALDIIYEVSGRDYGVVYEETELWYNYFVFDEIKISGLSAYLDRQEFNTAADQLQVVHDLFFAAQKLIPSEALGPNNSLTSIGQQWLLPKQLCALLGLQFVGTGTFIGQIQGYMDFKKTLVTSLIDNPLKFLTGKAWDRLKQLSVPGLHELYPELDDSGYPHLIYRPIPWGIDPRAYPRLHSEQIVASYLDLAKASNLEIDDAVDIISFNLGEDNHVRYNHFFVTTENSLITLESNISILKDRTSQAGRQFPFMDQLSVQRYGYRPMHLEINSLPEKLTTKSGSNKDGFPNADLLLQYNEVLLDYWQNAYAFESGTISIIGRPDVRVGKALTLGKEVPHIGDKLFYIESYTDEFVIDDKTGAGFWTQNLQVTRGIEKALLQSMTGFGHRSSANKAETGEYTHKG